MLGRPAYHILLVQCENLCQTLVLVSNICPGQLWVVMFAKILFANRQFRQSNCAAGVDRYLKTIHPFMLSLSSSRLSHNFLLMQCDSEVILMAEILGSNWASQR